MQELSTACWKGQDSRRRFAKATLADVLGEANNTTLEVADEIIARVETFIKVGGPAGQRDRLQLGFGLYYRKIPLNIIR